MKELRDRLDNEHMDFDREALWSRIDRPKKKRRLPFFWIFGLLLLSIVGSLTIWNNYITESNPLAESDSFSNELLEDTSTQNTINTSQQTKLESPTTEESTTAENQLNQKNFSSKHIQSESIISKENHSNLNQYRSLSSDKISQTDKIRNDKNRAQIIINGTNTANQSNSLEKTTSKRSSSEMSKESHDIDKVKFLNSIPSLSIHRIENPIQLVLRKLELPKEITTVLNPSKRQWSTCILSYLGSHSNSFINNDASILDSRESTEKGYIDIGLGLRQSYSLNSKFTATAEIGYAMFSEKLNYTDSEKTLIQTANGLAYSIQNTHFSIFNQYHIVHTGLGLNYTVLSFDKWQLNTGVFARINIAQIAHTDYRLDNDWVHDADDYSVNRSPLLGLRLNLNYNLSDNLDLMLGTGWIKSMQLMDAAASHMHSISPYGITVGVGINY